MARAFLLPPLVQERASLAPLATVSILNDLRPVLQQLQEAIEDLSAREAEGLDSLLQRTGSAIVFRGHPSSARHLDRRLRRAGLTTSVNLLPQD
jgi:hypothetical protein